MYFAIAIRAHSLARTTPSYNHTKNVSQRFYLKKITTTLIICAQNQQEHIIC